MSVAYPRYDIIHTTLQQRLLLHTMGTASTPLAILVVLEEMTAHLSQRIFAVAPDQALLQLLSILPDSVYKVEKLMSSTGH